MSTLSTVSPVLDFSDHDSLSKVLLYGSKHHSFHVNTDIPNSTITFIKSSKRFNKLEAFLRFALCPISCFSSFFYLSCLGKRSSFFCKTSSLGGVACLLCLILLDNPYFWLFCFVFVRIVGGGNSVIIAILSRRLHIVMFSYVLLLDKEKNNN